MDILQDIKLANYTTFKIGGPARFFVEVKSEKDIIEALKFAQKENLNFLILGNGSNILVNDKGFDGVVIKLNDNQISIKQNQINCASGVMLSELVSKSYQNGLSGMEWAVGIPGTVGGAIYGNAGAYGSSIDKNLYSVDVIYITPSNRQENKILRKMIQDKIVSEQDVSRKILSSHHGDAYRLRLYQKDCQFSYRQSLFNKISGFIILSSIFLLKPGKKEAIKNKMDEIIKARSLKIPFFPSAGSFFKNPAVSKKIQDEFERDTGQKSKNGIVPAGWLIEEVGLKGKKIGGAMVSEQNANFVVNIGKATAEDAIILASLIKQQVRDKFGVQLKEEINFVGF
jgi:UDP-N-acetylmuramate dehydrogenase